MSQQEAVLVPAIVPISTTIDSTVSTATAFTFPENAEILEINAIDQDVVFKWGTGTPTATDFDDIVLAGQVRHYPLQRAENAPTQINLIERVAGATVVVIVR